MIRDFIRMIQKTEAGWGVTAVRLVLGVIFFREGAMKFFGWFGGGGWGATCAYFASLGIPFPELNAWLVAATEFFGGVSFLLGFFTRLAAIPISITMVIAILSAHLQGGWSYPLLILASCFLLIQAGSGRFSLDRFMSR